MLRVQNPESGSSFGVLALCSRFARALISVCQWAEKSFCSKSWQVSSGPMHEPTTDTSRGAPRHDQVSKPLTSRMLALCSRFKSDFWLYRGNQVWWVKTHGQSIMPTPFLEDLHTQTATADTFFVHSRAWNPLNGGNRCW
jgi:hypothetical protein